MRYEPVSTIVHLDGGSTRASGLSPRTLRFAYTGACYFTRKHLGPWRARLLATWVKATWLAMLATLAPVALLMPLRGPRTKLRHRAGLLWAGLRA